MKTLPFFLLPAFLCAAPPEVKELIYQTVKAPGYTIDGVVISHDSQQPTLWDHERDNPQTCRFEYQLRIKEVNTSGDPLITRLIKDSGTDENSKIHGRGPMWCAFFEPEQNLVGIWRYYDDNGRIGDTIQRLYYWNFKKNKYITLSEFETFIAPDTCRQKDHIYPESLLSSSKKYLAVRIWNNHSNETTPLQNHIEVIELPGKEASLYEQQKKEIPAVLRGKPAKIDSVKWLPGDRLEYTFSEAMPTGTDKVLARAGKAVPKLKVPDPQIPFVVSAESLFQKKP